MGVRPLCYFVDTRSAAWSSDLGELVLRTRRADFLSDAFAARFMSVGLASDVTPYEGVRVVPPGTCVSIAAPGSVAHTRFWNLDVGDIRYPDARSYEDRLRSLWSDAVQARLDTQAGVWAELSGGLDSSAVVCMADRLIKRGSTAAHALRLISHATLESPEGDERRFIAEVERQVDVASDIVGVEQYQEQTDPARVWLTPYALQGVGLETARRVRAAGGRVILSGRLGDAVMGCQPDNSIAVFDDLARGAFGRAAQSLRAWSRATRKPLVALLRELLCGGAAAPSDGAVELLTPALQSIVRDSPRIECPAGIRRSKRPLARMILGYSMGARLDVPDRSADVVYAYPFTHRPLVEFMLAIPGEQLSAPGTTRALMRRAFADLLPPRILRRISKGYYPPAAFRAARRLVAALPPLNELEVVQRGWIDPARLRTAIRVLTDGGGASGGDVHCVLRLEAWLQARRHRAQHPNGKEVNSHEVLHA
jgi:asparagine synthase (glutamine-hydrolysing)